MPSRIDEQTQLDRLQQAIGVSFENIVHRDKPDFVVRHLNEVIGIETTDGSSEAYRRAMTLKSGLQFYSASGFSDSCERRASKAELLQKLSTPEFTSSEDNAVDFVERVVQRIRTKVDLFKRSEIERFERNWLCIINSQVDDWVLPDDFYRVALLGALGTDRSLRQTFDIIYVISDFHTFIIDRTHFIVSRRKT